MAAEQLEAVPILLATGTSVMPQLKNRLQEQYEQAYPGLGGIIRYVIDEEEANAWNLSSLFPHLVLPDLVQAHMARLGSIFAYKSKLICEALCLAVFKVSFLIKSEFGAE